MVELSKAGFSVNEVLSAAPGVVSLATAAQLDMARSSEILAGTIRGFGLAASDANHVADILAKTANASSVDVSDLGETFKYVAPVAKAMGFSLDDVSAAAGLLGNNMIKGSMAGTELRTIFDGLAGATPKAKEELQKLGVATTDSNGHLRDLHSILVDLRGSFSKLSDAQQVQAATSIGGREAMAGLLTLVKSSDEDFTQMFDDMQNANGAAKDMADTMQEGLAGALKNLEGSVNTLQIKFGEGLAPGLERVTKSLNDMVNSSDDTAHSLGQEVGNALANLTPVIPVVVTALTMLLKVFEQFAGPAEAFASVLGFVGDKWGDLTGKTKAATTATDENASSLANATVTAKNAKAVLDDNSAALGTNAANAVSAKDKVAALTIEIDNLKKAVTAESQAMSEASGNMKVLDDIVAEMSPKVQGLWKEFKQYADEAAKGGAGSEAAAQKAGELAGQLGALDPQLKDVTKAYQISTGDLRTATDAYHQNTLEVILNTDKQKGLAVQAVTTSNAHKNLGTTFKDLAAQTKIVSQALGTDIGNGIAKGINVTTNQVASAAANMVQVAIAAAKKEGGIHSPSTVAALEVGTPIAQGVGKGMTDPETIAKASKQLVALAMSGMKGQLAIMQKIKAGGFWKVEDTPTTVAPPVAAAPALPARSIFENTGEGTFGSRNSSTGQTIGGVDTGMGRVSMPATPAQIANHQSTAYTHSPNYNLSITTPTPVNDVSRSFDIMRSMAI